MFLLRTYYQVKPFLPHGIRLAFRRWRAERRQRAFAAEWPIKSSAAERPVGWSGWPGGKKFALVLTHDVERSHGLEQSRAIVDVEMERGFRSAFNFVPEGDYRVPAPFRQFLTDHGFEVGVHDLKHDGKLYWSRAAFTRHARAINRYLRDWNAVGFRSGFMHHNLDWLHDLEVLYDSSTFDTDPFEPQPDGVNTIFPFWVPRPSQLDIRHSAFDIRHSTRSGYIELPYTLAQDFTLFLLLQEKTIGIWKRKLDWIVEHGGMAMLDVHPDYVDVTGTGQAGVSYPLRFYAEFLDYVRQKYAGQFWQPLPKQIAQFARDRFAPAVEPLSSEYSQLSTLNSQPTLLSSAGPELETRNPKLETPRAGSQLSTLNSQPTLLSSAQPSTLNPLGTTGNLPVSAGDSPGVSAASHSAFRVPRSPLRAPARRQKIWIDLDNTPHVPFFEPIIEKLAARGFDVVLTARDAFQVCELADRKALQFTKIGRHYGKNKFLKLFGLFYRALQLAPFALREKPDLALSHGARSQIIISNLLRIPTVLLADYEFAEYPPLMRPTWEIVPEVIPDSVLYCGRDRIRKYPGIKEDVYVNRMQLDPGFLAALGVSPDEMLITVRPPATEAHYHNPEGEELFARFMERACTQDNVRIVLLPRNARQGEMIRNSWPRWFHHGRTIIPGTAVDGLNLLWYSDLVVSGGGTMNREAAALGVPVYSIFRGKTGAIDLQLQKEGRLVMIETAEQVEQEIKLVRRHRNGHVNGAAPRALSVVVDHIDDIARLHSN